MNLCEPESSDRAVAFLESGKVQDLLIDVFLASHSLEQRTAVRKRGFWPFACGDDQHGGRRTAQVAFLGDLYARLKSGQIVHGADVGALVDDEQYKAPGDLQRLREHIHGKFRREPPLDQLAIEPLGIGIRAGFRLSYFRSAEAAEVIRSRVGRPPRQRGEYPTDPVLRKILLIRQSIPVPVPRKAIDAVADEFLANASASLLILPGSCHSGKTSWMLDYGDRHASSAIIYPFDRADKELCSEAVFCRHVAKGLASLSSVPTDTKRIASIDSLAKLLVFSSAIHDRLAKVHPLIMVDALDEADTFADSFVGFILQASTMKVRNLRYVITVRTPTSVLSRLMAIPQSVTSRVFDERHSVLDFLENWLELADGRHSVSTEYSRVLCDKAGSNLQLLIQLLRAVGGDGHVQKGKRSRR